VIAVSAAARVSTTQTAWIVQANKKRGPLRLIASNLASPPSAWTRWNRNSPRRVAQTATSAARTTDRVSYAPAATSAAATTDR
jgi:hypothetical protein